MGLLKNPQPEVRFCRWQSSKIAKNEFSFTSKCRLYIHTVKLKEALSPINISTNVQHVFCEDIFCTPSHELAAGILHTLHLQMTKSQQASGRPPKANCCATSRAARGYVNKALEQCASLCLYAQPNPPAVTAITHEEMQIGELHLWHLIYSDHHSMPTNQKSVGSRFTAPSDQRGSGERR